MSTVSLDAVGLDKRIGGYLWIRALDTGKVMSFLKM